MDNKSLDIVNEKVAYYHLPGLFEFYDLYKVFLPIFHSHKEYFYDWCEIGSIYGAPADCMWGGGRVGFGENGPEEVLELMQEYGISSRLTFSNSLLKEEHLSDRKCNHLCKIFSNDNGVKNGIIIYSDILMNYLKDKYPSFYYVSSTTKVLTKEDELLNELSRNEFLYVVPDFSFNKRFDILGRLTKEEKSKVEFLCNECCQVECMARKACYENVSRKNLGENCKDHHCISMNAKEGYRFSIAMENPSFISLNDIQKTYIPLGFNNFKIEGRGLGSALILEFLLYYMTKPEYQLKVREAIYLDAMLDLF